MLIHETPEFLNAFFAYSDVLDDPPERHAPKYQEGSNLLDYMLRLRFFEEQQEDREGHEIFKQLRQALIVFLAEHLRLVGLAKDWNRPMPQTFGGITPEESAAIYQLLNFASEETQDQFMRGKSDFRQALIYAILKDGGLYDARGFWCEVVLP